MVKPASRKISLHISHVENALALYLKSFFPEAVEIGGVDINVPLSQPDGNVDLTVYFSKKENDVQESTPASAVPTDDAGLS